MKVAGKVVHINEEGRVGDICGARRQGGGAAIGVVAGADIVAAAVGDIVVNNGIPALHAVDAAAIAATGRWVERGIVAEDGALIDGSAKGAAAVIAEVVVDGAVGGVAVVNTARILIGGAPDDLATIEICGKYTAAADVGDAVGDETMEERSALGAAADIGSALADDAIRHDLAVVVRGAEHTAGRIGQVPVTGSANGAVREREADQGCAVGHKRTTN